MSLNQDNADEIYSTENVQVKSSSGNKRFILKSKLQKIRTIQIFMKTIFAVTVVALKVDNAEEICTAENMAKVLTGPR